jgi:uncharacterized protein YjeT (DUF2065 family)
MSDFFVALGLVMVIEGLAFAAVPGASKRLVAAVIETPEQTLRIVGVVGAVLGVLLVWAVRG